MGFNWSDYTVGQRVLVILIVLVFLSIILAGGQWLWVYFAPMFNMPLLSYWEFVGLWILVSLFFKR